MTPPGSFLTAMASVMAESMAASLSLLKTDGVVALNAIVNPPIAANRCRKFEADRMEGRAGYYRRARRLPGIISGGCSSATISACSCKNFFVLRLLDSDARDRLFQKEAVGLRVFHRLLRCGADLAAFDHDRAAEADGLQFPEHAGEVDLALA